MLLATTARAATRGTPPLANRWRIATSEALLSKLSLVQTRELHLARGRVAAQSVGSLVRDSLRRVGAHVRYWPVKQEWEVEYSFCLYVTGQKPASRSAVGNLQRLCDEHLPGRYKIRVVDILEHPQVAEREKILATPMVVRQSPEPIRRVIGDLSNTDKVLEGLDLLQFAPVSGFQLGGSLK
jgi:circadian clock protein KaiB